MKFRVLGAAPGLPIKGFYHAAVWCGVGKQNFLLDCGEGAIWQLMKYNLDKDTLDAIVISHWHPDHSSGLFMVLQMLYLQGRTKPLEVFVPERKAEFEKIIRFFYIFKQKFGFHLRLYDMEGLHRSFPVLTPVASYHMKGYEGLIKSKDYNNTMKAWSFIVENNSQKLLYTSDLLNTNSIKPFLKGVDVCVLDVIHPSRDAIVLLLKTVDCRFILNHGATPEVLHKLDLGKDIIFEIADENKLYEI